MFDDIHRTYEDGIKDGKEQYKDFIIDKFGDFVEEILEGEFLEIYKAYYEVSEELKKIKMTNTTD